MRSDSLVRIASCYRASDAALWSTCLEAAGFDVFLPGFHTASNFPHYNAALGGIPIMVRVGDAPDARALLNEIQSNAENAPRERQKPRRTKLQRIIEFILYWFTGTAPSLGGLWLEPREE